MDVACKRYVPAGIKSCVTHSLIKSEENCPSHNKLPSQNVKDRVAHTLSIQINQENKQVKQHIYVYELTCAPLRHFHTKNNRYIQTNP